MTRTDAARDSSPVRAFLALGLVLGAAGCSTVPVAQGPAGYAFDRTAGRMHYPAPVAVVESAALEALNELRCDGVEVAPAADGASRISGRGGDGRGVELLITADPAGGTTATARIGRFGDEPRSRALLQRIAVRIGALEAPTGAAAATLAPQTTPEPAAGPGVPDAVMSREQPGGFGIEGFVP